MTFRCITLSLSAAPSFHDDAAQINPLHSSLLHCSCEMLGASVYSGCVEGGMRSVSKGIIVAAAAFMATASAYGQGESAPQHIAVGQTVSGELSSNDAQRRSGKFEDVYLIDGHRGQRVQLDLSSDAFDSYLVVTGPGGFNLANDDREGGADTLNSRIVLQFPSDGVYRVSAPSYRSGETGAYRLQASAPAANVAVTMPVAAQPIAIGAAINGRLAQGDGRRADGSFEDRYRFHAVRGQRVTISLSADKMDTVLRLARPDGTEDVSDDTHLPNGETSTNSRLDTVLAEDGDYVITATSYRASESGNYRLTLAPSPGHPRQIGVAGGARVIALLVGVSEYGGRIND